MEKLPQKIKRYAKTLTSEYFSQVEIWMENLMEKFQDFNKVLISSLLRKLQSAIDNFNNEKANTFSFTPVCQVEMGIIVAGFAYKRVVAKLKLLKMENDPNEAMKRLKPIYFRTFETQFSETSDDSRQCKIFAAS